MSMLVESLTFAYDERPVLIDMSLEAQPGRLTCVLGPNAAGKSTLLRCLIGALRPQEGTALIDGRPAHRIAPRSLASLVAYVPQRSIVAAAFSARDVIRLGRYALPPNEGRVEDAIDRLDLRGDATRPFAELSVGQQQRVVLARAIAQLADGGRLVLDEPMAAMDLRHVRETVTVLRTLAAAGATVVMAMHDISLAAQIADDVWLLDAGRVIAAGTATSVMTADRLESIFGVPFTTSPAGAGRPILTPRILPTR